LKKNRNRSGACRLIGPFRILQLEAYNMVFATTESCTSYWSWIWKSTDLQGPAA
jgi:hypothetical protein